MQSLVEIGLVVLDMKIFYMFVTFCYFAIISPLKKGKVLQNKIEFPSPRNGMLCANFDEIGPVAKEKIFKSL